MDWYYTLEGQQYGPVSWEELRRLAHDGRLRPNDTVWNSTMGSNWSRAIMVPNLFPVTTSLQAGAPPQFGGAPRPGGPPHAGWLPQPGVPQTQAPVPPVQPGVRLLYPSPPPMPRPLPYGHAYAYTPPHAANLELPTSGELKRRSRASLRGNWTNAVLAILVYAGILVAIRLIPWPISGILQIVISGPLELGLAILFLAVTRAYPATLGRMFEGFHTMGTAINATMLRGLFIFLWSLPYFVACSGAIGYELMPPEGALLFFLPLLALGAVAFYSYRMVFYVIADRPGTGPLTAIRLSKRMMYGHKARLFRLDLSFIGWALLCVLSGGIGFLWLTPYMKASEIAFYDDMRARTGFV